jgi:hypothetical protein
MKVIGRTRAIQSANVAAIAVFALLVPRAMHNVLAAQPQFRANPYSKGLIAASVTVKYPPDEDSLPASGSGAGYLIAGCLVVFVIHRWRNKKRT